MNVIVEQSPHIRRKDSLNRMMGDVLIALSPVVVFALIVYQSAALRNILVSAITMVGAEFLFIFIKLLIENYFRKKDNLPKKRLKDVYHLSNVMVPLVSATIFALITPATYWVVGSYSKLSSNNPWTDSYAYLVLVIGSLFGMLVGKLIFGGTGKNILNPAATGFVFCKFVFGSRYAVANYSTTAFSWDIATGGTILKGNGSFSTGSFTGGTSILDLIIGNTPGLMGETCKIAILIGLVYLLIRHTIDWRVVTSFFGTFIFGLLFVGIVVVKYNPAINYFYFVFSQLFAGGVIFGGVFMITDPVTMPLSKPNRVLYGMIIALCTLFFRYLGWGLYTHEGMAFSILIGNAIVPLLDYNKFSFKSFGLKEIIVMAALPVTMVTVLTLTEASTLGVFAGSHYVPPSSSSSSGAGTGGTASSWSQLSALLPFFHF